MLRPEQDVFDDVDLDDEEDKDELEDSSRTSLKNVHQWLSTSTLIALEPKESKDTDTDTDTDKMNDTERSGGKCQGMEDVRMRTPSLVDELLTEIYTRFGASNPIDNDKYNDDDIDIDCKELSSTDRPCWRKPSCNRSGLKHTLSIDASNSSHCSRNSPDSDCLTEYSTTSEVVACHACRIGQCRRHVRQEESDAKRDSLRRHKLALKGTSALRHEVRRLETQIQYSMSQLSRQVKRRDRLRHRREHQHNMITAILQASSQKRSEDTRIRFSLDPSPGEPGFSQWKDAMKMVARLPDGVPDHFRRKLWLTVSERHLSDRGVDWKRAERFCFNEWTNPDDDELGLQIVRDLHRTGCSLYSGSGGLSHQLMLKRVLLGYARWNKSIGYCQGFNMLAAIILEVMDGCESEALKVMIFMIEHVLPEAYFANNLRGLSIDIAVFREVLKAKCPQLAVHLDQLQKEAAADDNYEPPLTNVFIMQWFLTLFATCLPRAAVLRVWDLILLEGNEVLIRTAMAIWTRLQTRLLGVSSADEFYCVMGKLSQEMLRYTTHDANTLVQDLVSISPFPFTEVYELRERLTYNISPWTEGLATARRGLRILYSDEEENDDEEEEDEDDDDERIAVAATFGISAVFKRGREPRATSATPTSSGTRGPSQLNVDKERLTVDISALRKQYGRLRQRQKQAQIVLTSAWNKKMVKTDTKSDSTVVEKSKELMMQQPSINHLLVGKKPLLATRPRASALPGSIPTPMNANVSEKKKTSDFIKAGKATVYSCPQPEVIAPVLLKRSSTSLTSLSTTRRTSAVTVQPLKSSSSARRLIDPTAVSRAVDVVHHGLDDESGSSTATCDLDGNDTANTLSDHDDNEGHRLDSVLHHERALRIVKENSEILDKIMRKKTQNIQHDPVLAPDTSLTTTTTTTPWRRPSTTASSLISQNSASLSLGFNPFPKPVMRRKGRGGVATKLGLYAS